MRFFSSFFISDLVKPPIEINDASNDVLTKNKTKQNKKRQMTMAQKQFTVNINFLSVDYKFWILF